MDVFSLNELTGQRHMVLAIVPFLTKGGFIAFILYN